MRLYFISLKEGQYCCNLHLLIIVNRYPLLSINIYDINQQLNLVRNLVRILSLTN